MQDVSLEVESNILASQPLKGKSDRKMAKEEYVPSFSHSQSKIDEMTKTIESLNSQLAKLKLEVKNPNKGMKEGYQRNLISHTGNLINLIKYCKKKIRTKRFLILSKITIYLMKMMEIRKEIKIQIFFKILMLRYFSLMNIIKIMQ